MAHPKLAVPIPFEEIMRRHQREIMRYLLRLSNNPEDAADLFQETWLRAYRAYPTRLRATYGVTARVIPRAASGCSYRTKNH
jgi:hypothetical protein